jgi:16S rRNA (guanine(966)-N(2))-methyltransferase RsmD
LRITGGKYLNRRIKCPPGIIRPAMDMMRESMFSILGDLSGLSFLDLFSGSGIVGIEAASRNAENVTLVEKDRQKKTIILSNLSFVESKIDLILYPAIRFIKTCKSTFDIIYLDPPFNMKNKMDYILLIAEKEILNPDGIIFIHIPKEDKYIEEIKPFTLYDKRKYGRSILLFYHR